MFISRLRIGITAMVMAASSLAGFDGVAQADGVRIVVPAPFFFPTPQFQYDGYYRTHRGRYYHYDRDRDGWHYGRSHREGQRYEARHQRGNRR